jgi:hypothetical protein
MARSRKGARREKGGAGATWTMAAGPFGRPAPWYVDRASPGGFVLAVRRGADRGSIVRAAQPPRGRHHREDTYRHGDGLLPANADTFQLSRAPADAHYTGKAHRRHRRSSLRLTRRAPYGGPVGKANFLNQRRPVRGCLETSPNIWCYGSAIAVVTNAIPFRYCNHRLYICFKL